jgi:hypothetical protein
MNLPSFPMAAEPEPEAEPVVCSAALEQTLSAVERRLSLFGQALHSLDLAAVDAHGLQLHRELLEAVQCFAQAASQHVLPTKLKQRLAQATGKVAAQRETLARATEVLDHAIDVLIEFEAPASVLPTTEVP